MNDKFKQFCFEMRNSIFKELIINYPNCYQSFIKFEDVIDMDWFYICFLQYELSDWSFANSPTERITRQSYIVLRYF